MNLGSNIRALRLARGLTLEQLSEASGVDVGTISALEQRDSTRSKYTAALARGLGMSMEELLGHPPALYSGREGRAVTERTEPEDDGLAVAIPQYAVGGAMGKGLVLQGDQPGIIRNMSVTREWAQKNLRSNTGLQNLCIVTGFGDSMKPLFNPGDPLIVDQGVKACDVDAVYFFRVGDEGFIKRLQRVPGEGVWALSANKEYKDWLIKKDADFEVFGRVLKAWKGEDL